MTLRFFLGLCSGFFLMPCWGNTFITQDRLAASVHSWATEWLTSYYSSSDQRAFEVTVARLDRRLKLPQCAQPVQHHWTSPYTPKLTSTSVKVSCSAPVQWSVLVPIKIERQLQVAVAKFPLVKGQILSAEHIQFRPYSSHQAGYG
jgi:flagella basal body P-ring formation protein FlgA